MSVVAMVGDGWSRVVDDVTGRRSAATSRKGARGIAVIGELEAKMRVYDTRSVRGDWKELGFAGFA